MTDLSKMTQLELLDLRFKIQQELDNYANREKTKVFAIFIEFTGTRYFIKEENALKAIAEMTEEKAFFSGDKVEIKTAYLDNSNIEICEDYYEQSKEKK